MVKKLSKKQLHKTNGGVDRDIGVLPDQSSIGTTPDANLTPSDISSKKRGRKN